MQPSQEQAEALASAHAALTQDRHEDARAILQGLISASPSYAAAHHALALAEMRARRFEQALQCFQAALHLAPHEPQIHNDVAALLAESSAPDRAIKHYQQALLLEPAFAEALINLAGLHLKLGNDTEAESTLTRATEQFPTDVRGWHGRGVLEKKRGAFAEARSAFDRALALAPGNARVLFDRARVETENSGVQLGFYERAHAADQSDLDIVLGLAMARFQAGDDAGALDLLDDRTSEDPHWESGQQALAQLRWELGQAADFTQNYERPLAKTPGDARLWSGYIDLLIRAGQNSAALEQIERARRVLGEQTFLDWFEAVAASEADEIVRADGAFARLDGSHDPSVQIGHLKHLLRARRPEEAAALGERLIEGPHGAPAWPYLATAWRILGDERWRWLEGDARLVSAMDIGAAAGDLDRLAQALRRLHTPRAAPLDQTIRSGTQTYGNIFDRQDPEIVALRRTIREAVREYIAGLPAPDPKHPLLREPRQDFRFAGSWSVRLTSSGFHTNHTHPLGWISSAFYVSLPTDLGDADAGAAGWLALGQPPVELNLDLPPTRLIRPQPGLLVLFPSTLWHGTVPFKSGERLTVAFDAVPTQRAARAL